MPVVDMRSRPTFLHTFFGAEPDTPEFGVARWLNARVGSREVEHFTRGATIEGFRAEMDGAGIDVAVMVARSVPGVRVSNDALAAGRPARPEAADRHRLGRSGRSSAARPRWRRPSAP